MFSARKTLEIPPSKRNGPIMASRHLQDMKRQRLLEASESDGASMARVLLETPECSITSGPSIPSYILDEWRKEQLHHDPQNASKRMFHCRAHGSAWTAASPREYYVFVLRSKLLLWAATQHEHHPEQAQHAHRQKVITLLLPEAFHAHERSDIAELEGMVPFLFAFYGSHLSLMLVGQSGLVLFWEDIALPYESVPLSVQIPLQANERVTAHPDSILYLPISTDHVDDNEDEEENVSLVCWSNQGNVWEIAMEDRRIRIRTFEKQQSYGFLTSLTKSVSQFFFASSSTSMTATSDGNPQSIQLVKAFPSPFDLNLAESESMDLLVLCGNGTMERRRFNVLDVMDCSCASLWQLDLHRVAIAYFSEHFPSHHLAKVAVVAVPYVHSACFGVVIAFVCSSRDEGQAKVKYALLQFALTSPQDVPEPEWACVMDYEPSFSALESTERYFTTESLMVAQRALYLVWPRADPMQFASIVLPQAASQSNAESSSFAFQNLSNQTVVGAFGSHVSESLQMPDAVTGAVRFLLVNGDRQGSLCTAVASTMQSIDKAAIQTQEPRVENASNSPNDRQRHRTQPSIRVPASLSTHEYTQLLMKHFYEDPYSSHVLAIASSDIRNVAQAAIAVDFQILDAKPSSGLRWGKDGAVDNETNQENRDVNGEEVALVTPKLVRFQLEEKQRRHVEFIEFLQRRCPMVWEQLLQNDDLVLHMVEVEEKLQAAIALSKFQASLVTEDNDKIPSIQRKLNGHVLLRAIERTVEHRGYQKDQLRLAGYNAFDVFYCEVSKITELFHFLNVEIKTIASNAGESSSMYLYALLESGLSMQSLLRASPVPLSSSSSIVSNTISLDRRSSSGANWIFTRAVREVVVDHLARLSLLLGYSTKDFKKLDIKWPVDEVFGLTNQLSSLGSTLLDAFVRFLPHTTGETLEDLKKEADLIKRVMLNPLVYVATTFEPEADVLMGLTNEFDGDLMQQSPAERKRTALFAKCVDLCDQYQYYEGMVYLMYAEDLEHLAQLDYVLGRETSVNSRAQERLIQYCESLEDFSEFVFRWYTGKVHNPWLPMDDKAKSKMLAFLMAHPSLFGGQLHYLVQQSDRVSQYAWLTSIATSKFDQTATLALHQAMNEPDLAKRKTLTSIAKIAALATPMRTRDTMHHTRKELNRIKIQSVLSQLPLEISIPSASLSSQALVETCLQALSQIAADDPLRTSVFVMCLEALENATFDSQSSEFDALLTRVWRECIQHDAALWEQLLQAYADSVNEELMEAQMRETLLFNSMVVYMKTHTEDDAPAALTIATINQLVQQQPKDGHSSTVIGVRSRQLFVKTLNLAQA